ncbi:MAG: DUF359 domain-containing protein [Candidatus Thermoplasmatota archaeon]
MMYKLPDSLRPALAAPFGPIHDTGEARRKVAGRLVIAIGDVVTQTFLDGGIVPKLMVIDGVTKRGAVVENALQGLPTHGVKRVEVYNPAAAITQQLVSAMDTAIKGKGVTVINVKGEEDLAALPAMIIAPDGTAVCYGQPNRGVVIVVVDAVVRKRAQDILNQMEVK